MSGARVAPGDLAALTGSRLGASSWHEVGQDRIDLFARTTGDHQWIHRAGERADAGPFGGPIAHGYLLVALLAPCLAEVLPVDGVRMVVNKGLDRLRFHRPVRAGADVRVAADLVSATTRPRGFTEVVLRLTMETREQVTVLTADARVLLQSA
ncbi:MaoC family dehydratase [Saccharothrix sp. NPDC042600]|uniref:MaoC family dehydratase n=1 Tax=Saccharothrix TaxID=2071 RepID=UPI0034032D26|nr:MaoC family dehydratase [Saccharothrix mutabilis subsp. capreolus]